MSVSGELTVGRYQVQVLGGAYMILVCLITEIWGAYFQDGLFLEGLIIRILQYIYIFYYLLFNNLVVQLFQVLHHGNCHTDLQ